MRLKHILYTMGVAAALVACHPQNDCAMIDALYDSMTQQERIAQLRAVYMNNLFDENDRLDTAKCRELIPDGIGHCSQFALNTRRTPDQLRDMVAQLQDWLINNTHSGIPALMHEEVLSGVNGYDATVYPQQIGLACSFNTELAEEKTRLTATALRKVGGHLALSPMVDVVRTPSFNRLEESYGEDAYLSAAMGVAFVKGLQAPLPTGEGQGERLGVAACTKHFLGYGGGGDAPEKELMEEILLPHETIIRTAGSHVLMPGYHLFHGEKCAASSELLQGILRDYLGFDGMVVSDYGAVEQVDDALSPVERAAAALNAGNDVDFPEGVSYAHLQEAIDKGLVTEETLERAVKRVLKIKQRLGLLDKDKGQGIKLYEQGHIEWDTPEERATAYKLATQSVVLLKNDGVLPLKPQSVFLTGPNANTMWAMLGDYTYNSMRYFWKLSIEDDMHPHIVGLKEGMESRLPEGCTLTYSRGCDWTDTVETVVDRSGDPRTSYMYMIQNRMIDSGETADEAEALALAAKSDVIIAAVGENAILCGENRDRSHLRLPGRQEEYVNKLIATGKPVVLVIFGGRAQVISGLAEKCAAVIQAWYPGEEGGNAVADILYGNVSPSGKLSVTYPAVELHEPICYSTLQEGDSRVAWPFGFGLSYTTFEYGAMAMESEVKTTDEHFTVAVEVKNTSAVAADEIVQLYAEPVDGTSQLRPKSLQGFKRVSLQPGEAKTVTLTLSPQQLGHYNNKEWHIAPGSFRIQIAASSADVRRQATLRLTGDTVTMPHRTQYFAR